MSKNEIDVLVMAHNICVSFDWLPVKEQEDIIKELRKIERGACKMASILRLREEEKKDGK